MVIDCIKPYILVDERWIHTPQIPTLLVCVFFVRDFVDASLDEAGDQKNIPNKSICSLVQQNQ